MIDRTFAVTGPRYFALVRYRRRPWLQLNRWFATQVKSASIVCQFLDPHSTGARPSVPSFESDGRLVSSIRSQFQRLGDRPGIVIGSGPNLEWRVCANYRLTIGIQTRSKSCPKLDSHSAHQMVVGRTSPGDRGTKPRGLKLRERPSWQCRQTRAKAWHAWASRLRSKRHVNGKEEPPPCPALRCSLEPRSSCCSLEEYSRESHGYGWRVTRFSKQ